MTGVQTCALRSEEHTSELQSHDNLVCRLLLEKKSRQGRATEAPARHGRAAARTRPNGRVAAVRRRWWALPHRRVRPCALFSLSFFFLKNRGPPESSPFPHPAPFRP